MGIDKGWMAGSTAMLLLRLLEERDRYGYQMIEELRRRSDHTFDLKAGTLYPLLHGLEEKGWITSYQGEGGGRTRKYYHLTEKGRRELKEKRAEGDRYTRAGAGGGCLFWMTFLRITWIRPWSRCAGGVPGPLWPRSCAPTCWTSGMPAWPRG